MLRRLPILVKVIILQVVFLVLHYAYEWFPGSLTFFISATNESIYQHMKIAFYAYFLFALLEYALKGPAAIEKSRFLYARLLGLVLIPLLVLPCFLLESVLFVKIESIPLEVIFANLALAATSASTLLLVEAFETGKISRGAQWALLILFFVTALEFATFNYRLPWFDIFAIPPGW